MSTEENKAIIRHVFEEAVNRGNVAVIDEFFGAKFIDHTAWPEQAPGPAGIKQAITEFRMVYSDLHVTVEDMIAEGDRVATRETWRASHPSTGKQVVGTVMHIFWITGGQVVAEWSRGWDWLEQLE